MGGINPPTNKNSSTTELISDCKFSYHLTKANCFLDNTNCLLEEIIISELSDQREVDSFLSKMSDSIKGVISNLELSLSYFKNNKDTLEVESVEVLNNISSDLVSTGLVESNYVHIVISNLERGLNKKFIKSSIKTTISDCKKLETNIIQLKYRDSKVSDMLYDNLKGNIKAHFALVYVSFGALKGYIQAWTILATEADYQKRGIGSLIKKEHLIIKREEKAINE